MLIVVPMAGVGQRFVDAGYREPKPLIPVEGRAMIEHVIDLYPGAEDFLFIVNEDHLRAWPVEAIVRRKVPRARIVAIPPHKLGPVPTVLAAVDEVPDDEEVVVSYCDFGMVWDFAVFRAAVRRLHADGAIPCYRGFHPHSLGSTLYAYVRERDGWLEEIREKGHFTPNRMDEFASAGVYYFRTGALVKRFFAETVRRDVRVNNEYYVSVVYNLMHEAGLRTLVWEVERFLQWGTPEDLGDYAYWSTRMRGARSSTRAPVDPDTVNVMLLAGRGQRFVDASYREPKPSIPVAGVPMVARAAAALPPARRWRFVCLADAVAGVPRSALAAAGITDPEIVVLPAVTEGQAHSALAGIEGLAPDTPVLIAACDFGARWDAAAWTRLRADPAVDVIAWTFRGHPTARTRPRALGWMHVDGDRVVRVSVKEPISDRPLGDHAITGTFWFRRADTLRAVVEAMTAAGRRVNGEFYLDEALNVYVERGLDVRVFEVEAYFGWGTPDDLRTFEYWQRHFGDPA